MCLDHISYVTSHDQLADTVQRLGSRLGSTFVDGGVHPRFGTRNFTLPLLNGQYLEVVCPLDHPAADASPFGRAVSQRANEGGGWLTWIFATEDISRVEDRLGRSSTEGHRMRPDGKDLKWKQLGVLETIRDSQLPFFIQWLTTEHPSIDGNASVAINKIKVAGSESNFNELIGGTTKSIMKGIKVSWVDPLENDGDTGIISVYFKTLSGIIEIW